MARPPVHVLKFDPIYKHRIWGGRKLEAMFHRTLPSDDTIGESWELADLPEDTSVVACGPAEGRRLDELIDVWGDDLLGRAEPDGGQFPLLVKFLDANAVLSVQVHPDYATAKDMGGDVRAKYEAWVVLDSTDDACIYRNFKPGVTRDQVEQAIENGTLAELLVRIPAKRGDWFYLPGGTVHALGAGLVVSEIQTPSDTTFRLYDWNRVDPQTGKGRQLHVEQGLKCLSFDDDAHEQPPGGTVDEQTDTHLVDAPTFALKKCFAPALTRQTFDLKTTRLWVILTGRCTVGNDTFRCENGPGDVLLAPAGMKAIDLAADEDTSFLEAKLLARR